MKNSASSQLPKNLLQFVAVQDFAQLHFLRGRKIIFVTDEKIWQNCRRFFAADFLEIAAEKIILSNPKADDKTLKKIAAKIADCDLIVGLGSGTINDLCKYSAAQKNIDYAIIVSAASMNGYLSKNASITLSGHKKSLPAKLPVAVFCDLKILQASPVKLTKAGIGDVMCFYSCWFDWYLSHKIFATKFDVQPFLMLQNRMNFLLKNFQKFKVSDEKFLKILIEILMLSGYGMTMAEGSYPASQSEHLIAHAIEMKYPKIAVKKLHGEMIAVATMTSLKLQKKLLEAAELCFCKTEKMPRFFAQKIAVQCHAEYRQKIALKPQKIEWLTLKKELQKIHLKQAKLSAIFDHFKIRKSAKSLGLSKQQYQACVANAKFVRNRVTCLDFFK